MIILGTTEINSVLCSVLRNPSTSRYRMLSVILLLPGYENKGRGNAVQCP